MPARQNISHFTTAWSAFFQVVFEAISTGSSLYLETFPHCDSEFTIKIAAHQFMTDNTDSDVTYLYCSFSMFVISRFEIVELNSVFLVSLKCKNSDTDTVNSDNVTK